MHGLCANVCCAHICVRAIHVSALQSVCMFLRARVYVRVRALMHVCFGLHVAFQVYAYRSSSYFYGNSTL